MDITLDKLRDMRSHLQKELEFCQKAISHVEELIFMAEHRTFVLDQQEKRSELNVQPTEGRAKLTDQERKVFRLVGDGLANKAIAKKLGVSTSTIEAQKSAIKVKLRFSTTEELNIFAAKTARSGNKDVGDA